MEREAIRRALDRAGAAGAPRLEVLAGPRRASVVGLVPGSFDPMTVAHAALAEAVDAEATLFVFSPATLPKEEGPGGSPGPALLPEEDRVASLLAYCRSRPTLGIALCTHGLLADQADAAGAAYPRARILFAVGSDKVAQLVDPRWYEDRDAALVRLFDRAEVTYGERAGDRDRLRVALAAAPAWARIRRLDLDRDVARVSSRAVRAALRRGEDAAAAVPSEIRPFLPLIPGEA